MRMLEFIRMPPQSAADIETLTMFFLKNCIPTHLSAPDVLSFQDMTQVAWLMYHYRIKLVDGFFDILTEAQVNFLDRTIEITEPFLLQLENGNGRSLFTFAHELSHIIFHSEHVEGYLQTAARNSSDEAGGEIKTYESAEWQAEHSAGALLMPIITLYPLFRELLNKGYEYEQIIEIVAEKYGVTEAAAASRIRAIQRKNLQSFIQKNEALFKRQ